MKMLKSRPAQRQTIGEPSHGLDVLSTEARRYALRNLPFHLIAAHQRRQYRRLLTDFNFLQAKIVEFSPQRVIEDYNLVNTPSFIHSVRRSTIETLRLAQSALRMSSDVLMRDANQLASQLLGRLSPGDLPDLSTL